MKDFRDLKVWYKAHALTLESYQATKRFPADERFGLISQIRRSSASIPTNIAEGCGRGSDADLSRFLQIAMGSSCELEYQFLLAHDLGYLSREAHQSLNAATQEIKRMLSSFIKKLKADR